MDDNSVYDFAWSLLDWKPEGEERVKGVKKPDSYWDWPQGWQCPVCKLVWSPEVVECRGAH